MPISRRSKRSSPTARSDHRDKFFIARMTRTQRRLCAIAPARISFGFARERGLSRHGYRAAGFRLGLLCFPRRGKAGRSASERAGPAQCQQRSRGDRPRHRARNSVRENRRLAPNFSTPAGVSKSSTRAIDFCWWTITRIIRPRFARRSPTAKSTGRNRVLTMFQPHRYSRTKALRQEFGAPSMTPIALS